MTESEDSAWLLVETLVPRLEPTVVADGWRIRDWTTSARAGRPLGATALATAVVEAAVPAGAGAGPDVCLVRSDGGCAAIGVPIFCSFDVVYGVHLWVGASGQRPPPRRAVAAWDWDSDTELAHHGPGLERIRPRSRAGASGADAARGVRPDTDRAITRTVSRFGGGGVEFVDLARGVVYEWTGPPPPPLDRCCIERPVLHPDDRQIYRAACAEVFAADEPVTDVLARPLPQRRRVAGRAVFVAGGGRRNAVGYGRIIVFPVRSTAGHRTVAAGNTYAPEQRRQSVRVLGTVGLNPEHSRNACVIA